MADENTTLGNFTSEDFKFSVSNYLGKQVEDAERIFEPDQMRREGTHLQVLGALRDLTKGLGIYEPRLLSLSLIAGSTGQPHVFSPGPLQKQVLRRVAAEGEGDHQPPTDETTLNELVMAGISDLIKSLSERNKEMEIAKGAAESRIAEYRERAEAGDRALIELDDALEELGSLRAENDQLKGDNDYLRIHLGERQGEPNRSAATHSEKPEKPERRTKVEGHTGVYFFVNGAGEKVYEIGWKKDSKQHWQTIGPDLEEAITIRKETVEPKAVPV